MMTDNEINEYLPRHADMRRAKEFVDGWATGNATMFREAVHEATATGHPVRFIGAFAEMLTRAYDLRDNPDALAEWRTDIELHAVAEIGEQQ